MGSTEGTPPKLRDSDVVEEAVETIRIGRLFWILAGGFLLIFGAFGGLLALAQGEWAPFALSLPMMYLGGLGIFQGGKYLQVKPAAALPGTEPERPTLYTTESPLLLYSFLLVLAVALIVNTLFAKHGLRLLLMALPYPTIVFLRDRFRARKQRRVEAQKTGQLGNGSDSEEDRS